jgi:membrane protease YdiL (CAAX protease family)
MTAQFTGGNGALLMAIRVLSFQGATLLLVQRFLHEQQTRWATGFGLSHRPGMAVVYGFLVASTFLPIGWLLQLGSFKVLTLLQQTPEIQPAVQALKENVELSDRVVLGIVAIVLAPLAEEMLFRGILYPAIKQAGRPQLALWLTSLAFAAVHAHAPSFLSLLLLALSLTWIYEYTRNLLAPIVAHACFNAFNFISGIYGEKISDALNQLLNRS